MAGLKYTAIVPKKYTDAARAKGNLDNFLRTIAVEAQKELQTYPAWRPWKNPPTSGPHAGGKRTGTLGRGWGSYQLESGRSVQLLNHTEYAPYVQGTSREQARALAARGWPRVDEVAKRAIQKAIARIDLKP